MLIQFLKDLFVFDSSSPLLFTQFYFWAFFAFVFIGFSLLKSKVLLRNTYLCFVSLFFYYKTSGLFVLILIFATLFNYFQGLWIHRSMDSKRRIYLILGVCVNLFVLCYFKYSYFFADVLNAVFGLNLKVFDVFSWLGNTLSGTERFDVGNILLPVGISFYTFQNISYIMDVYREKTKPLDNMLNFGFYVSFFPQLVAGPIIRASEFIPQIIKPYFLSRRQFGLAVFWIINGLAKKIIISDYIAVNFVDRVFGNPGMFSGFENLVALFGYSLQVYADFSGYTDIAIGVAMLMGFYLPKNFDSPYKATNPGNFWKRWHISLSSWLKDYLYIPIGGNRRATFATYFCITTIALIAIILAGNVWVASLIVFVALTLVSVMYFLPARKQKIETNLNLMNTMLLGGLWHGASWNFMIWGGLNGLGIVVYKYWRNVNLYRRTLILFFFTSFFFILFYRFQTPIFTIGLVWIGTIFIGTLIRTVYSILRGKWSFLWIGTAWAVLQTFVFVTFTRLFFRAGSNLDSVEANEAAWNTAQSMVARIGSKWDFSLIPGIIYEYRNIFLLIIFGMIVHWLPDRWKRRYRILFTQIPLITLILVVVAVVFIIYQFVSADLQTFIYFQF